MRVFETMIKMTYIACENNRNEKILEARLSKEDNILKGRLNDVKNKKVKLLSREQVFSNL